MIKLDRKKRITADKALKHPWFQKTLSKGVDYHEGKINIDPDIM